MCLRNAYVVFFKNGIRSGNILLIPFRIYRVEDKVFNLCALKEILIYLEWKFRNWTRAVYNIAGLHVEISRHEKFSFLYLNVISWGLLLNSVPKTYSILLNNRRHSKVSHNQRTNTAEFLRIPPSCGPRIFEACTRKVHKKSKNYASKRGPIEHLVIILQTPQGVCKKLNLTLQGGPQVAECPRVWLPLKNCCCSTEKAVWSPDDDVIRTHTVVSAARSVGVEAQ